MQLKSLLCMLMVFVLREAHAQLAITEVMSQASTNLGSTLVIGKSDFWELTNFGTNTIALDGYTFSDRDSDPTVRVGDPFRNCFIAPGESIILLRTDTITNRQDFLNWWGAGNLRTDLQVRSYPKKPGFDAEVDAVQLFDRNGDLVDRVDFGRALRGHTFVYDAATGEFGEFSTAGVGGAFKAAAADDVGSPGVTTGPVPLSILQQPSSITDDAGADVEFSVRAGGLPRPSYQWFMNGITIPGARTATFTLTNIQPSDARSYTVRVNNGLVSLLSEPATLAVNTNPSPARIVIAPSDALVFEGQTAVFSVKARGYPPPAIQWQTNGVNVAGATSSTFEMADARVAWSGTLITVRVQNAHGVTNASARLQVTKPPRLAFTEVMASVAGGSSSGHTDWFELTNLDSNAVDLLSYRFSDRYSFEVAFRITNSLIIKPGESVIFVERLTPEEFIEWWGRDRLPLDLKITTYSGLGFSSSGDVINLWNSAETDPYSPVAAGAFLESTPGVTLRFIPPDYYFVEDSVRGTNGAFRAANGGDIGSPGYTTNPPPRFVSIRQGEAGPVLKCRVVEGKSYDLLCKPELYEADWATVGNFPADDCVLMIAPPIGYINQRFFLLKEAP
jgi:hypothetical protein